MNTRALPKYLTQDEVTRLFKAITDKRDRALFGLIYYYGLRVSEVTLLTLQSVDLKNCRIRLRRLKGGIDGEKRLWSAAVKLLRAYLKVRIPKGVALFTGRQGPLKRRMIEHLFSHYAEAAGLSSRNVHALRHSIAVHILDSGRDLEDVQDHLGHKHITSTAIYAKISSRRREAFAQHVEYNPAVVWV